MSTRPLIDQLVSKAISGYVPKGYLFSQILPFIPVKQTSGKLPKVGSDHLRIVNSLGGGRGKYRQVEGAALSTTNFLIEAHGLTTIVSPDDYRNAISPFDAEKIASLSIKVPLLLEREKALADVLGSTAIITQNTTLAGAAQFSDPSSDPITKAAVARAAIYDGTGAVANVAVMNWAVAEALKYHPAILDALGFKEQRPGGLNYDELAKALQVEKILVGTAKYNSAKEGQTAALANVWGNNLIFASVAASQEDFQPNLGYSLGYSDKGKPDESSNRVYKQPLFNPPGANELLVEVFYDDVIENVNAAYLIKNAIA